MTSKDPFKKLSKAGVGLAGLTIVTGVGGAIGGATGVPTAGFSTLASFGGIAATGVGGMAVLDTLKQKKGKKKKYGMY